MSIIPAAAAGTLRGALMGDGYEFTESEDYLDRLGAEGI